MNRTWVAGFTLAVALAGLAGTSSCSTQPQGAGGAASTTGAGHSSSTWWLPVVGSGGAATVGASSSTTLPTTPASASAGAGGGLLCAPDEAPGFPGWVKLSSWSPDCPFFVPPDAQHMPPPIAWVPCPDDGTGIACRKMQVDWVTDDLGPIDLGSYFVGLMDVDQDLGATTIMFRRNATTNSRRDGYNLDLIADVDGPVLSALLSVPNPGGVANGGCTQVGASIRGGRFAWDMLGKSGCHDWFGSNDGAAVGGTIGDLEPVAHAPCEPGPNGANCAFFAGASWVVRLDSGHGITAFDWLGSPGKFVSSPGTDPDGNPLFPSLVQGDAVFFENSTSYQEGVNVWTESGGAKPFIRYVGETTRAAGSFGADGKDMVWSYGEGTQTSAGKWPTVEVRTAPFTTDPSAVQERRLRSCPTKAIDVGMPWVVGCGYAAKFGANLMIVRLSDGMAWFLPYQSPLKYEEPLGLTCDELFVFGYYPEWNVARVRLDSLGPGIPAD